jgi:hypothetical protein
MIKKTQDTDYMIVLTASYQPSGRILRSYAIREITH